VELTGGGVLGLSLSDGGDYGPTTSGMPIALVMIADFRGGVTCLIDTQLCVRLHSGQ